jgi:hypothetical protein
MISDTPQDQLRRMYVHFDEEGFYVKANYCLEIIDCINELERFRDRAFGVYPNIDLDIESVAP